MEQEVFPSQAFQNATDDMVLLRLNTEDGADGTNIARQFQATSLPTFLILNGDRQLAGMIRGYQPAPEFVKLLQGEQQKYKDFQVKLKGESAVTDPQKRLDLAKELRMRYALDQSEQRFQKLVADRSVPAPVRDEAFYELALTQLAAKKYVDSMNTLKKFGKIQKEGENFERSRLLISDVYIAQNNFPAAAENLREFKRTFPKSKFVPNVDYVLPQIEKQIQMTGSGKK
jgi:TolA-binding protein